MCKTGTGESCIIRVGSQYVTNVWVKGKVDKKSEDLWLPATRYLAFSFLPRRETFMNLKPSPLVAKPAAPLQFRPRTGVPAKTLAVLTRWVTHATPQTWIPTPWKLEFQSNLIFNCYGTATRKYSVWNWKLAIYLFARLSIFKLVFISNLLENRIELIGFNKGVASKKKKKKKMRQRETIASRCAYSILPTKENHFKSIAHITTRAND